MIRYTPPRRKRPGGPRRGPPEIPPERWRNQGYLDYLRQYGFCCVCRELNCDPAHGPPNGRSQKGPDAEAIPLCRTCHNVQTIMGWRKFELRYGIDRETEAAEWFKLFCRLSGNNTNHLASTPEHEHE